MLTEHRYRMTGRTPGGFELYGAIAHVLPAAHGAGWAIAPVARGFVIRGPESAPALRTLTIRDRPVEVRLVESAALEPAPALRSPVVIIRLTAPVPIEAAAFRARVGAHIVARATALGAAGVEVEPTERGVRVHGRLVRGFAVRVSTPDPAAALAIMTHGIGGKRSMGCGVFAAEGSPWC